MRGDVIETLVCPLCPPTATEGFHNPFTMERLCRAFGENLGGNAPEPSWFDGYDVVVAVRQGSRDTPHMPTTALLRRRTDGALRLVASDHVAVRGELGCDFMLAPQHRAIVRDAILDACDDGVMPKAATLAFETVDAATPCFGEGPVDILAIRREREDLKDARTAREMAPRLAELRGMLDGLRGSTRRADAISRLAALAAAIGVDEG